MAPPKSPQTPRKILALHGVAQSGPVFQRRCQNIVSHLTPLGYSVTFITAPHSIEGTAYTAARQADYQPGDVERSWWTTDDREQCHPSLRRCFAAIAHAIRQQGPFAGALGFSQGGCAAASLGAMLEASRRRQQPTLSLLGADVLALQPPLDFLLLFSANPYRFPMSPKGDVDVRFIFYPSSFEEYPYAKLEMPTSEVVGRSGGKVRSTSLYAEEYSRSTSTPLENRLSTPTLAFYGQKEWDLDPFSRGRQQWFISRFTDVRVQAHPWKHTVPRTDEYAKMVVEFVGDVEGNRESTKMKL